MEVIDQRVTGYQAVRETSDLIQPPYFIKNIYVGAHVHLHISYYIYTCISLKMVSVDQPILLFS